MVEHPVGTSELSESSVWSANIETETSLGMIGDSNAYETLAQSSIAKCKCKMQTRLLPRSEYHGISSHRENLKSKVSVPCNFQNWIVATWIVYNVYNVTIVYTSISLLVVFHFVGSRCILCSRWSKVNAEYSKVKERYFTSSESRHENLIGR